jgi:hypothetical protein
MITAPVSAPCAAKPVSAAMDWPSRLIDIAVDNPSAVVALAGLAFTILFFWLGSRRNRMEATFDALELLQDKDSRNARFNLQTLLAKAAADPEGFRALTPEERADISSIALQFGFIGTLIRQRRVFSSIIFEAFASSIVLNHHRLRGYADWRKSIRPVTHGSLWNAFDELEGRARRFILIRSEPFGLSRLLVWLRLSTPPEHSFEALKREALWAQEAIRPEVPSPEPHKITNKLAPEPPKSG